MSDSSSCSTMFCLTSVSHPHLSWDQTCVVPFPTEPTVFLRGGVWFITPSVTLGVFLRAAKARLSSVLGFALLGPRFRGNSLKAAHHPCWRLRPAFGFQNQREKKSWRARCPHKHAASSSGTKQKRAAAVQDGFSAARRCSRQRAAFDL